MNLQCTADGNPAPSITWARLSDNSTVNESFIITGKEDEGTYICTADNDVGSPAYASVNITVQRELVMWQDTVYTN